MKKYLTIDEYISQLPKETQVILQKIRQTIKSAAPMATEAISYGIPTFKLNGNLVHFGGFKNHIGFFPGSNPVEFFKEELKDYKTSKGTIQFPLDKPIPHDLIKKIVKLRVEQNTKKVASKA